MSKSIVFRKGAFTGTCINCNGLRIFLDNRCVKCGWNYPERENMSAKDYIQKYFDHKDVIDVEK